MRSITRLCQKYLPSSVVGPINVVGISIFLFFLSPQIGAEIHPKYYAEMQRNASEYIEISVERLQRGLVLFGRSTPVTIKATVMSVFHSKKGLQNGDVITIKYSHFKPGRGWAGPRPIPLLREKDRYPAFLTWSDDEQAFVPAARGWSFERQIEWE